MQIPAPCKLTTECYNYISTQFYIIYAYNGTVVRAWYGSQMGGVNDSQCTATRHPIELDIALRLWPCPSWCRLRRPASLASQMYLGLRGMAWGQTPMRSAKTLGQWERSPLLRTLGSTCGSPQKHGFESQCANSETAGEMKKWQQESPRANVERGTSMSLKSSYDRLRRGAMSLRRSNVRPRPHKQDQVAAGLLAHGRALGL